MPYIVSNNKNEIRAIFTAPCLSAKELISFNDPRLKHLLQKYANKDFYAIRNQSNNEIFALFMEPNEMASETIPVNSKEVRNFIFSNTTKNYVQEELKYSDVKMSRVLEDLIEVLMKKNIINITDLPSPAQETLLKRNAIRRLYKDIENIL